MLVTSTMGYPLVYLITFKLMEHGSADMKAGGAIQIGGFALSAFTIKYESV